MLIKLANIKIESITFGARCGAEERVTPLLGVG